MPEEHGLYTEEGDVGRDGNGDDGNGDGRKSGPDHPQQKLP